MLDAVETLTGPEITCNPIQHVRAKPPTTFDPHTGPSFHVVPWHQDAGVMMGCMMAIPEVHDEGYRTHLKEGGTTIAPELMPDAAPVLLERVKGDVIFMTKYTPHPDFVVRLPSNPATVMNDYAEWCRLWVDAFENPRGVIGHRAV